MQNALNGIGKNWWMYLVIGILFTLLGIAFFYNVGFAIKFVAIMFAVYFLASGIVGAITSVVDRKFIYMWGLHLVLNILMILVGISMFTNKLFAAWVLYVFCGVGFLCEGIMLIVQSIQMKKLEFGGWVVTLIFGILILLTSFGIMAQPVVGLVVVGIMAGFGALFAGISNIVISFQIKKFK